MTIPKSYEALAADLASEKIISKTLLGQKEAYMMLADSRKIELDDALARETELKSGLKTTLNDLHGRDDAVYDLRIDLKAAQDRESALREELAKFKAGCVDLSSQVRELEHKMDYYKGEGMRADALQQRLTVAEQRAGELEGILFGDLIEAMDDLGSRHDLKRCREIAKDIRALKPAADAGFSSSEFTKKSGKSARAPVGLKKDQIVEVFGGGQTQIARVDKTDWRHVEMWRVKL